MIVNRYSGYCQSCNTKIDVGAGFAYKNGYKWFSVCASSACHRRLGLSSPVSEIKQERKVTDDGVVIMPYDRDAIPLLRSMPGARWNPENKTWTVSVEPKDLQRVVEIADQLRLDVSDTLRQQAMIGTSESREALARAERTRNDGSPLFPYQKKGVEFLALHDRALLGDMPGLGKTVQALVALPENERVIIICPSSVKYNWRDEAEMWRPDYKVTICSGRNSLSLPNPGEIVITNYEILPSWLLPTKDSGQVTKTNKEIKTADLTYEQSEILNDTTVIADECHKVKKFTTAMSQKVFQLSKRSKRVWFLSGTPLMNRPQDLFGVLSSGNMYPLGNWNKFVQLFNGFKNKWGGYEFGLPTAEVPERLKRVMLRRLKSDVLTELPPKTYQTIHVNNLSDALVTRLNDFIIASTIREGHIDINDITTDLLKDNDKVAALIEKLEMVDLPSFEEFASIRALLAEARIPAMLEIVESYEDSDTPLVVFSAHKAPINELGKRDGWAIITGDVPSEERRNIVHKFQNGELKGVGLTIQAGGMGITLTRASNVLFVDLDWTPSLNIQAEDRVHRIGATADKVIIQRMSSTHPLDKHMQRLIEYKMELAYRALEASIKFNPIKQRPLAQDINIIEETDEELKSRINSAANEANRAIAIDKLQKIAGREAAKVNDIPEPKLTADRKNMLRNALAYMVSICDGAFEKDGMGFNKPDASIGHWINATGLRDEDDLAFRVLERILCRYRRQLKGQFEEIWKPE